jgi:hypothetical protein
VLEVTWGGLQTSPLQSDRVEEEGLSHFASKTHFIQLFFG